MPRFRPWRFLAGEDAPGRPAPPLAELLHPAPLAAVLILAVNDHILKGRGLVPAWLTGKLSDFAGVFFLPLLLTAAGDTLAWGLARATGLRIDFSLRRGKLALALAVTALAFAAVKLWPPATELYVRVGWHARAVSDPTDLVALVMLWPAWRLGLAELRRVPLGRLEVMARGGRVDLADVRALQRDPAPVDQLASALARHDAAGAAAALRRLRM